LLRGSSHPSITSLSLWATRASAIGEVASAIRNHPSSTTDNGALSALADRLDGITVDGQQLADQLRGLAVEEQAEDTGGAPASEPPVEPAPPSEPAPAAEVPSDTSGGDTGSAAPADNGGDGTVVQQDPPASEAPLGGEAGSGEAGSATGAEGTTAGADASASDGTAATASGDGFNHNQ
jgi:hypothetical protein